MATARTNTCKGKTSEICREIGFFSGESCWDCLQSRSLGTEVAPTVWLTLVAPVFLSYSQQLLYIWGLLVSGWGEIESGPWWGALKGWRTWLLTLLSLSWREQLFLAGEFPLALDNACFRDEMMKASEPVFLFLLMQLFSSFCSPVLLKFLSGLHSSSLTVFVHRLLFNYWSLFGDGGWSLLLYHLGDIRDSFLYSLFHLKIFSECHICIWHCDKMKLYSRNYLSLRSWPNSSLTPTLEWYKEKVKGSTQESGGGKRIKEEKGNKGKEWKEEERVEVSLGIQKKWFVSKTDMISKATFVLTTHVILGLVSLIWIMGMVSISCLCGLNEIIATKCLAQNQHSIRDSCYLVTYILEVNSLQTFF